MRSRGIRAALLPAVLAVGAIAAAACHPISPPPPPPPVNTLCAAVATPAAGAQVALVAQGGTRPTVVKFQASTQAQVWTKVAQLNQTGQVLAVGPDQPVHAQTVTPGNNPEYANGNQKDFQASEVDFPAAWNAIPSEDGTGVRVAVIDTGVQADHPDLAGNVTSGNDLVFGNASSNFARVDGNGHGTHVAGTIAAVDNTIGVIGGAPHSTIVPVRVLDCQGTGSTSTVASGIEWASDPNGGNVKVISMSLGGPGANQVLQTAIQDALNHNVLVVSAAGNCGDVNPDPANCPAGQNTTEYPGAYADASFPAFHNQGVIAVGALDGGATAADGHVTSTSMTVSAVDANFTQADVGFPITDSLGDIPAGTTINQVTSNSTAVISHPATNTAGNDVFTYLDRAAFSNANQYVTVAAPGVNIESTLPFSGAPHSSPSGYGFLSGTSMATPHVSAVAALIYQRCPNDTPTQVEARILAGQTLAAPSGFQSAAVKLLRADAVVSGTNCP
jgi:subtilisin family serine protease